MLADLLHLWIRRSENLYLLSDILLEVEPFCLARQGFHLALRQLLHILPCLLYAINEQAHGGRKRAEGNARRPRSGGHRNNRIGSEPGNSSQAAGCRSDGH